MSKVDHIKLYQMNLNRYKLKAFDIVRRKSIKIEKGNF